MAKLSEEMPFINVFEGINSTLFPATFHMADLGEHSAFVIEK